MSFRLRKEFHCAKDNCAHDQVGLLAFFVERKRDKKAACQYCRRYQEGVIQQAFHLLFG
jgi:aspartate carbamoyltransferase regulatory subunit